MSSSNDQEHQEHQEQQEIKPINMFSEEFIKQSNDKIKQDREKYYIKTRTEYEKTVSEKYSKMNIAELEKEFLDKIRHLLNDINHISIRSLITHSDFKYQFKYQFEILTTLNVAKFFGDIDNLNDIREYMTRCSVFIFDCYLNIVKYYYDKYNIQLSFATQYITKSELYRILVIYNIMIKMYIHIDNLYDDVNDDVNDDIYDENRKYIRIKNRTLINIDGLEDLYSKLDDTSTISVFFSSKFDHSCCHDGTSVHVLPFYYSRYIINFMDSRIEDKIDDFMCLNF